MTTSRDPFPLARSEHLTITAHGDDLLIFDGQAEVLHCLNRPLAAVWRHCDGHTSVTGIATAAGMQETAVGPALDQLAAAGLLIPGVEDDQ